MTKPPQELRGTPRLRSNELPPETVILLRGGPQSVDELVQQSAAAGRAYTLDGEPFYSLSLTAIIGDAGEDELLSAPPLVGFAQYYRMTAGQLYAAGYTVWATFRRPTHYDVRLPAATSAVVEEFLVVAGDLHDNEHHES